MAFIPIIIVFILYFSSIPISFALFGSSMVYFSFINLGSPPDLIFQKYITSASSFSLLAIPFFIMAGSIMNYSGISDKLMRFADVLTGHLPGGLGQVNVVLSLLMGGVSGSANADAAMQSKMLVPEMEKRGYSKSFSSAITAASSAVTPVIPPGINLIIFALLARVSVGKLFLAAYIPGALMALALMVTVHVISVKRDYKPTRDKKASLGEIGKQALESVWALIFPFGIIGGLRAGIFTASEAGAIAALYTIIIGVFVYKELKWKHFIPIMRDTVYGTSSVVLIVVSASVFGYYMTWERIPQMLASGLLGITQNKYLMLFLINILLLLMGMFLEGGAAMIIIAPLLIPVVSSLGIDLVHFGIIVIVNIMIGGITPPFGSMMFTVCSITGCPLTGFIREVIPFIFALLVALALITYIPIIAMILPNLIY